MMRVFLAFSFLVFFAVQGSAQEASKQPLDVVPEVDLDRYAGTWYEIARLPNFFRRSAVVM